MSIAKTTYFRTVTRLSYTTQGVGGQSYTFTIGGATKVERAADIEKFHQDKTLVEVGANGNQIGAASKPAGQREPLSKTSLSDVLSKEERASATVATAPEPAAPPAPAGNKTEEGGEKGEKVAKGAKARKPSVPLGAAK